MIENKKKIFGLSPHDKSGDFSEEAGDYSKPEQKNISKIKRLDRDPFYIKKIQFFGRV